MAAKRPCPSESRAPPDTLMLRGYISDTNERRAFAESPGGPERASTVRLSVSREFRFADEAAPGRFSCHLPASVGAGLRRSQVHGSKLQEGVMDRLSLLFLFAAAAPG